MLMDVFNKCFMHCYLSPSGSELVKKLNRSQSRVIQPAAGVTVVTVSPTCQLTTSSHLTARAKWQVQLLSLMRRPVIGCFQFVLDNVINTRMWSFLKFDILCILVVYITMITVHSCCPQWCCPTPAPGEPEVPQSADQPDAGSCWWTGQKYSGESHDSLCYGFCCEINECKILYYTTNVQKFI